MSTIINNYEVKIIRKNNKHTYIRIKDNFIVVTTNYLTPRIVINKLIKDNYKEIEKMILKDKNRNQKENDFCLFGKKYNIIYDSKILDVMINGNNLVVRNDECLDKYIYLLVKDVFLEHLRKWYNLFEENIPNPDLKIRKMKTRWGVCNTKSGKVTLNYYLYKYDLDCLDYVIVHELSHFLEPNHSKKFWKVVERYYPNYKEIRKKLRS